jgi:hypothetical protein
MGQGAFEMIVQEPALTDSGNAALTPIKHPFSTDAFQDKRRVWIEGIASIAD